MPARSDAELVVAIADGDETAAEQLDARHRPRIEAIVRRRGVPAADCPDVAQEVLVDALRQIAKGGFRLEAAVSSWLYKLVNGKVVDYLRRQGRNVKTVSLDLRPDLENRLITLSGEEERAAVEEALSRLSTADRFLLNLHEREGYTLKEIGPMLGIRKSAVDERLQRARDRFRQALLPAGSNPLPKRLKG